MLFKCGSSILLVGPHYILECTADYLLTMLAAKIDVPDLQCKHGFQATYKRQDTQVVTAEWASLCGHNAREQRVQQAYLQHLPSYLLRYSGRFASRAVG